MMTRQFTITTWRERDLVVAQCLDIDVASQGVTEQEAIENLKEALALTLEHASQEELQERLREGVRVSSLWLTGG
jgi:predicted RNase H-like HicB family nuclease